MMGLGGAEGDDDACQLAVIWEIKCPIREAYNLVDIFKITLYTNLVL